MPISSSRSSNFYTKILSAGIDSPIAGLTANDSTKNIFTTMQPNGNCCLGDSSTDPVNPVFIRSTTCWAKNIDTSPISPWNNGGGYPIQTSEHAGGFGGTGTLISPRHILFANHFRIKIGKKLIFVDMNNTCYIRTLTNSLNVFNQLGSTDIQIGVLDSDLPSNVSFCKVASFDFSTLGTTTNKIPVFYTDQERKALIAIGYGQTEAPESYFIEAPNLNSTSQENAQRANFYELPIGGDSGSPVCFVYNNKLILLFTFTAPWAGTSAPYHIDAINSAMTTLGGGYTLSLFNKNDIISQEKNISIKKQNATFLKPYSINGGTNEYDPNAVYIFKGGSTNTVSTVFNYLELTRGSTSSNSDMIFLSSINALIYYKGSGIAQGWKNASTGGDATNLVINDNEIIYFTPISNKQISVSSGAIIQRYSNGKASLKKSNLSKLISTGSFIFVRGSNNTIGTFSNGSEFVNNNNSALADVISIKSPGEGVFTSYYFRADGINWRRSGSAESQNNTVILDGSIIVYTTYNSVLKEFTVQGNNIVRVN